jgi:NADH:ubiquinone oxidoreductase subunit 3 (subunit A)
MTVQDVLSSPPAAGIIFLALAYALYWLGGKLAAKGDPHPGKRQPYACGEDLLPPEAQLTYHAFFQLALMFALLHLATVVISTLPASRTSHRVALVYLFGIVVSVLVLTKGEEA